VTFVDQQRTQINKPILLLLSERHWVPAWAGTTNNTSAVPNPLTLFTDPDRFMPKSKQAHIQVFQTSTIPDCCNLGVVFRVLIFVNAVVLLGLFARGSDWLMNVQDFIESSTLVELICLGSLAALCAARQFALRVSLPARVELALCGLLPAAVAYFTLNFLREMPWFDVSFPRLDEVYAVVFCALMGIAVRHYFVLRNRAFSPALNEARLQALQSRIRPHFLFNSLNAVLSLIRTEPRRAETALEDLADLFRVLMRDNSGMSTLEQEVRFCQQYLAVEKLRLGERMLVEWDTDDLTDSEMQAAKIPTLLLQPLLENAVHYGVEPSPQPATIHIRLSRSIDKIVIRITNPCFPERNLTGGNHMALDNIRQRLALLYDIEARLVASANDNQFEVKLQFPYST
jgi:two-component system, LytTR family, sensor histidine kinase AlgZ